MTEREMFDVVVRWFQDDDWKFDVDQERQLVITGVNGESGKFRVYVNVQNGNLVAHSVSPTNAPQGKLSEMAEYITRANYGLVIGNFEMDYDDGEVRYKTSIKMQGGSLAPWMVHNLVYVNCAMMDRYYPGMMNVIFGGASPEQAIRLIEGN